MTMKTFIHLLAAALFLLPLFSCSTIREVPMSEEYANEFIGKSYEYINYVCGKPSIEASEVNNGKVLVYNDIDSFAARTAMNVEVTGDKSTAYVQFFLDENGNCYAVRTNHIRKVNEFNANKTWAVVASSVGGSSVLISAVLTFLTLFSR